MLIEPELALFCATAAFALSIYKLVLDDWIKRLANIITDREAIDRSRSNDRGGKRKKMPPVSDAAYQFFRLTILPTLQLFMVGFIHYVALLGVGGTHIAETVWDIFIWPLAFVSLGIILSLIIDIKNVRSFQRVWK